MSSRLTSLTDRKYKGRANCTYIYIYIYIYILQRKSRKEGSLNVEITIQRACKMLLNNPESGQAVIKRYSYQAVIKLLQNVIKQSSYQAWNNKPESGSWFQHYYYYYFLVRGSAARERFCSGAGAMLIVSESFQCWCCLALASVQVLLCSCFLQEHNRLRNIGTYRTRSASISLSLYLSISLSIYIYTCIYAVYIYIYIYIYTYIN